MVLPPPTKFLVFLVVVSTVLNVVSVANADHADFQCVSSFDCVGDNAKCRMAIDVDLPKTADRQGQTLCQCPTGSGGDDCSATCGLSCQNGGSCRYKSYTSTEDAYGDAAVCDCRGTGHIGENCEIPFVSCGGDFMCLYGGTCADESSSEPCICPSTATECYSSIAPTSSGSGTLSSSSGVGDSSSNSGGSGGLYGSSSASTGAVVGVIVGLVIVVVFACYISFKVIRKRRSRQQQEIESAKAAAATSDLELTDADLDGGSPIATAEMT
eukprot:CAMPEP_0113442704 /NCGR_PEP_ID=MMETSP0014_2-20120614/1749_1 /TAXON_ID=2857 /ORGANISM="Nitzschia sp." /LENGTH=268 /DNA_ID=CAMNT_0000333615 /DNA_START=21 /DNA_END=827 /DNA_ORIENTATION=- /assembly_acc=CAM_ASM_000159